jgi:hypothetical protein
MRSMALNAAERLIDTLIRCGCSRCGRRLIHNGRYLPCVIDALKGTPTAVHCPTCAGIVEAGRKGQDAALASEPMDVFGIALRTEAERREYEAEYRRTMAILGRTA